MKKLLVALCAIVVLALVPACGRRDRAYSNSSSSKTVKARTVKRSPKKREASTRQIVHESDVSTTSTPAATVVVD